MNILCICAQGLHRSKHLAQKLQERGHETRYGGIDLGVENPLQEADISWAERIIFLCERHKKVFLERFTLTVPDLVLGVTDNPELIPEEYAKLKLANHESFYERWSYPQVDAKLETILPLQ